MARAFIIMCDSFGIGATADAERYDDLASDTLRHIAEYCSQGKGDQDGLRKGPLKIPNLIRLGINEAAKISQGSYIPGFEVVEPEGLFGCAAEQSLGKDTQSGHWELAGVPVTFEWGYFKKDYPSFPEDLINKFIKEANLPGILGNKHASGTEIIKEFGLLHQKTNKPIVYTSADSVFQIAAHEETFGLDRLYRICDIARVLVDTYNIGRVIARPFIGSVGNYKRTAGRRDYATPPPQPTLLDHLKNAGGTVIAIGKVADIYAHQGITKIIKADGNKELFFSFIEAAKMSPPHSITFVNLVDFDSSYGHRRDVLGYAKALEDFDSWLPTFEQIMQEGDIAIITADHGCDPTFKGTDHTREHIPVLAFGPKIASGPIGKRNTFADVGQSIAKHLSLDPLSHGTAFI